jgi:hypothetical protein
MAAPGFMKSDMSICWCSSRWAPDTGCPSASETNTRSEPASLVGSTPRSMCRPRWSSTSTFLASMRCGCWMRTRNLPAGGLWSTNPPWASSSTVCTGLPRRTNDSSSSAFRLAAALRLLSLPPSFSLPRRLRRAICMPALNIPIAPPSGSFGALNRPTCPPPGHTPVGETKMPRRLVWAASVSPVISVRSAAPSVVAMPFVRSSAPGSDLVPARPVLSPAPAAGGTVPRLPQIRSP